VLLLITLLVRRLQMCRYLQHLAHGLNLSAPLLSAFASGVVAEVVVAAQPPHVRRAGTEVAVAAEQEFQSYFLPLACRQQCKFV